MMWGFYKQTPRDESRLLLAEGAGEAFFMRAALKTRAEIAIAFVRGQGEYAYGVGGRFSPFSWCAGSHGLITVAFIVPHRGKVNPK